MTDDTIYVLQSTPGTGPPAGELEAAQDFKWLWELAIAVVVCTIVILGFLGAVVPE